MNPDEPGREGGAETLSLHGLLLSAEGDGRSWRYRPLRPDIARGSDGRPQFALLQAGSATMLALTASWGVASAALAAARAGLAARTGVAADALVLRPEAVVVGEASLSLGDGQGQWQVLASAGNSGISPYHAAFNLLLDAGQARCVRKALGGERDWLALAYRIQADTGPHRMQARQSARSVQVEHYSSVDGQVRQSSEQQTEETAWRQHAPPPPQTWTSRADAADWNLAAD